MTFSTLLAALALTLAPAQDAAPEDQSRTPVNERLDVTQLGVGVWMHTSYHELPEYGVVSSNGLIVERADSVVLIDPAWGEAATRKLLDWVERETGKPVALVLVTHSHDDRTEGLPVTRKAGAASIGLDVTARILMEKGEPGLDIGARGTNFGLGSSGFDAIEVFYPGPGHAPDNLVAYIPREKILFGGCLIREANAERLGNLEDADLAHWPEAADAVAERFPNAKIVVPGHGTPGGLSLVENTAELAREAQ